MSKEHDAILSAARRRMQDAIDGDRDNREEALDDLKKLAGEQWPQAIKQEREDSSRPVLTINRLPQFVRQVTGDIRKMNPAINVLPGDSGADGDTAELVEGLIRQIQYKCGASNVFERAAESAAQCGMGFFRIRTEYEGFDTFNQEILIEPIHNPFSVYCDPKAKLSTRADAEYWFITEHMSEEDFKEAYPKAAFDSVDSDGETQELQYWRASGDIVVAEYFYKEYDKITIGLLADGTVVEDPVAPMNLVKTREAEVPRIMWSKVSGADVLEGPQELPGRLMPIVACMGEEMHVGERVVRTDVVRFAKDPQQLYNYWRTAQTELVALQPKAPYIVTTKQVQGLEAIWATANESNRAYLPYNPDEKAPPPQRATPPIASQGMMQEVMTASEDMKATTGVYDAGLGNRSNESSGVAIRQRQMESDVSTSIYSDNLAKAIEQAGRIIVGMIPSVYDTRRALRIMGKDDAEKMVVVNDLQITQDGVVPVNDLTIGKYDVRVSVGPNYSTMRQETAQSMVETARAYPPLWQMAGDLIVKNMDWPGADDIADRLKKSLPPQMRAVEDMSPEEQAQMQQAMQQQAQAAQMQQAEQQADIRKTMAEATEAEADAEKARFDAMSQQLELMAQTGQLDAAISQLVQREVTRALTMGASQGVMPQ